MSQVVTFGDALFRFSSLKGERLANTSTLNMYLAGTELNVAVNLKSLGCDSEWVSSLPDGPMGELIRSRINQFGINFSNCQTIQNGQAGWYLMESGSAPRADFVYERRSSSMALLDSFNFNWDLILKDCKVFHSSGVTAGMSSSLTQEIINTIKIARAKKILVSYDFNYRRNLWSLEDFVERQKNILPLIDILFCSNSDLELFFGHKFLEEDYSEVFDQTNIKTLVMGQRTENETQYHVTVFTKEGRFSSKSHPIQNIDRIGVGDSMTAGYLWGHLNGDDPSLAGEKAAAAGAFKYSIKGDMASLSPNELNTYLEQGYKAVIR